MRHNRALLFFAAIVLAGCQALGAPALTPSVSPAPVASVRAPAPGATAVAAATSFATATLSGAATAAETLAPSATADAPAAVTATVAASGAPATSTLTSLPGSSLAAPWNEWTVYGLALRPATTVGEGPAAKALVQPSPSIVAGMTQYHLALTLPSDLSRVDGEAALRYTNREATPLDSIYLHLFPNLSSDGMTVSDVRVFGQPVSVTLEAGNSLAKVALWQPLAPGQVSELALRFSEPIPAGRSTGNYGEFALQDGVLALAGFYPTVAVYDDKGWHRETPVEYGDVVYADASLYDVTLTAPANLTVAASGSTQGRTDNGDGTASWRMVGGPMRDFNIVASAGYAQTSKAVGDITVNSYALAKDAGAGRLALDWAASALATYETAFGPYPYRELDVVETATRAGGIEYPGLIVVAEGLYSQPERRIGFEIATVHEVAHQWWYNVVGDDQVNNPWLDEAMAQYSEEVYFRTVYGAAQAEALVSQDFQARLKRKDVQIMPIGLPVAAYTEPEYNAIVYGRGPLFLLALRDQIGQAKMSELLRRYYREFEWQIATPADFRRLAEQVSGQDLGPLFKEWVYAQQ